MPMRGWSPFLLFIIHFLCSARVFAYWQLKCDRVLNPPVKTWTETAIFEAFLYLESIDIKVSSLKDLRQKQQEWSGPLAFFFRGRIASDQRSPSAFLKAFEVHSSRHHDFFQKFEKISKQVFAQEYNFNPFKLIRILRELANQGITNSGSLIAQKNRSIVYEVTGRVLLKQVQGGWVYNNIRKLFGDYHHALRLAQITQPMVKMIPSTEYSVYQILEAFNELEAMDIDLAETKFLREDFVLRTQEKSEIFKRVFGFPLSVQQFHGLVLKHFEWEEAKNMAQEKKAALRLLKKGFSREQVFSFVQSLSENQLSLAREELVVSEYEELELHKKIILNVFNLPIPLFLIADAIPASEWENAVSAVRMIDKGPRVHRITMRGSKTWDQNRFIETMVYLRTIDVSIEDFLVAPTQYFPLIKNFFKLWMAPESLEESIFLEALGLFIDENPDYLHLVLNKEEQVFYKNSKLNPFQLLRLLRRLAQHSIQSVKAMRTRENEPLIRSMYAEVVGQEAGGYWVLNAAENFFGNLTNALSVARIPKQGFVRQNY